MGCSSSKDRNPHAAPLPIQQIREASSLSSEDVSAVERGDLEEAGPLLSRESLESRHSTADSCENALNLLLLPPSCRPDRLYGRSVSAGLANIGAVGSCGRLSKDFSNRLRASISGCLSTSTVMGLGGNFRHTIVRGEDGTQLCLKRLIGTGGFGRVYQGDYCGRNVAVKVLESNNLPGLTKKSCKAIEVKSHQMAELEAVLMALVGHENVVQTLKIMCGSQGKQATEVSLVWPDIAAEGSMEMRDDDDCEEEEAAGPGPVSFYIVMEIADFGSLVDGLRNRQFHTEVSPHMGGPAPDLMQWDAWAALETLREIAAALKYLHGQGIIHGDMKAANVLLFEDQSNPRNFRAKVTDFGFSRVICRSKGPISDFAVHTSIFGTVTHMPPELMKEGTLMSSADIYSFGVIMWEVYTGQAVYKEIEDKAIVRQVIKENLRPVYPPDAPKQYVEISTRCWDCDPMVRPSAEELLKMLKSAQEELCPLGLHSPGMLIARTDMMKSRRCSTTAQGSTAQGSCASNAAASCSRFGKGGRTDLLDPCLINEMGWPGGLNLSRTNIENALIRSHTHT